MNEEFLSQTELGKLYGVSSHMIGRWLTDAGLRGRNGKPCGEGWNFVTTRTSTNVGTFFYVWNRTKTTALLAKRGHQVKVTLSEPAHSEQSAKGETR
jgi:hypothetical protein